MSLRGVRMKNVYTLLLIILTYFIFWPANSCSATDVWVYHSNYDNVDVFLMDDTLTHGINENGRYFQITVKEVRNGQLLRTVMWEYEKLKYESDPWRYETSTMTHDHTCAVIAPDHLFEYCMNWLGWGYTIREHWYI